MKTLVVVCRPEVAAGFRLAGLPVREASTTERAEAEIDALRGGTAGLVLVEDVLYRDRPVQDGMLAVPFPGPSWEAGRPDERIVEILRRAIGYRVRL